MLRIIKIGLGPLGLSCTRRSTSEPISEKSINRINAKTACVECVCLLCVCMCVSRLDFNSPEESYLGSSSLPASLHKAPLWRMCFLPCGRSQQDLPVVAATVNEDITSCAVGACSAEALRGVALLQRALVLLHGQTVVGQTQLFVGRLRVQFERLTWGDARFFRALKRAITAF